MICSGYDTKIIQISLKDNWREKKKTFFKNTAVEENTNHDLKKTASTNENPTAEAHPQKKAISLSELAAKCKKEIEKKV